MFDDSCLFWFFGFFELYKYIFIRAPENSPEYSFQNKESHQYEYYMIRVPLFILALVTGAQYEYRYSLTVDEDEELSHHTTVHLSRIC